MYIIKPKTTVALIEAEHWSMVESKARPNGQMIVTMGLFKDAGTANDTTKCLNNLETIDIYVNVPATIWTTPQEVPVAYTIYQEMIVTGVAPSGYFAGCNIGF